MVPGADAGDLVRGGKYAQRAPPPPLRAAAPRHARPHPFGKSGRPAAPTRKPPCQSLDSGAWPRRGVRPGPRAALKSIACDCSLLRSCGSHHFVLGGISPPAHLTRKAGNVMPARENFLTSRVQRRLLAPAGQPRTNN